MLTFVEQLSVAVAVARSSAAPHSTVTLEAQVRTGAIVSSTVIDWVHSAKLPQASVARYTRVTFPGHLPTSPLSLIRENVTAELQLSLAAPPAAWNAARFAYATGMSPTHWTEMLGQVLLGLVVSTTVMVCSPLVELPHWSIAVHRRWTVRVKPQLLLTPSL